MQNVDFYPKVTIEVGFDCRQDIYSSSVRTNDRQRKTAWQKDRQTKAPIQ